MAVITATSLWATLGIAATDDRAAIRRAYAARLKVVHPEDDPEGFKRLRAAYEQAIMLAERALARAAQAAARADEQAGSPEPEPAGSSSVADGGEARPDAERAAATAEPPLVGRPARQAEHEAVCNRLAALLTGTADPPPRMLDVALDALLASPGLDEVSTHLQTETWLARLICHAVPRSDAIIDRAAAAFGWKQDALYVADPAVAGAIARLSGLANGRLLSQLDELLAAPAEPEENRLFAALDKVTAPSVARHPQQGPSVEVALAKILLQRRPRSDPLMHVATRRLAWDAPARQASADPAILEVARLAGQLAPRRRIVVPQRTAKHRVITGMRTIWLLVVAMGLLSFCVSTLSNTEHDDDAAPAVNAAAPSGPAGGPQVQFFASPARHGFSHRITIVVSSSQNGAADLNCVAGDGWLRSCSLVSAMDASEVDQARYFARGVNWSLDNPSAPAVGERVPVHITFKGV